MWHAHHMSPIDNYSNDGHSHHPKVNSQFDWCTVFLFLYIFFFFPPISAPRTPRSLPQLSSRESYLPSYHPELSASSQRPWMWPSVYLWLIESFNLLDTYIFYTIYRYKFVVTYSRGYNSLPSIILILIFCMVPIRYTPLLSFQKYRLRKFR